MMNIITAIYMWFLSFFGIENSSEPQKTYTNKDIDILARTIWGEARGEGAIGMQAVANVVMNRYQLAISNPAYAKQFGSTIAEICQKPWQFSVWNKGNPNLNKMLLLTPSDRSFRQALDIARKAVTGELTDVTNGADHYRTAYVNPRWSRGKKPTKIIKSHLFFKLA